MGRKIVIGAILFIIVAIGWQIVAAHLANAQLQEDLRDLAAQAGVKVGLIAPSSDDDLRASVVAKAEQYGIHLKPEQVTVRHRSGVPSLYLQVNYDRSISLLGLSMPWHFNPDSAPK